MQIQIYLCGGYALALVPKAQSQADEKGFALLPAVQPAHAPFNVCGCAPSVRGVCSAQSGAFTFLLPLRNFIKNFSKTY